MALTRRYHPAGEVREYLASLRADGQRKRAATKLDIDLQALESSWPGAQTVTTRTLRGWEPLRELKRSFDGVAYRIFFCIRGNELWLLSACEKGSEATPRRELERAYRRMREVLEGRL